MALLAILSEVPLFVWPLFLFLLIGGLRARKTESLPIQLFQWLPLVIFFVGVSLFWSRHEEEALVTLPLWAFFFALGGSVGFLHMRVIPLRFDKALKRVEIPGSPLPLILSMTLFTARFAIGMGFQSEKIAWLWGLEFLAAFLVGVFAGRGVNCFSRFCK